MDAALLRAEVRGEGMRVICAWCQREGRSWLLRIGEPIDDTSETHGICDRHQQAMFEMFPSRSFPSTRWLLIVSPGEPAAYSHLTTVMRGVEGVTVIVAAAVATAPRSSVARATVACADRSGAGSAICW